MPSKEEDDKWEADARAARVILDAAVKLAHKNYSRAMRLAYKGSDPNVIRAFEASCK